MVNGGQARATRTFRHDNWYFGMDKVLISPTYSYDRLSFKELVKGDVIYEKDGDGNEDSLFTETFGDQLCDEDMEAGGYCYEGKTLYFSHGSYTIKTLGGHLRYEVDDNGEKLEESGEYFSLGYKWQSPDDSWYEYDGEGRVVSSGALALTRLTYGYDADGNISTVRDSSGNLVFSYNYSAGRVSFITDREGRRVNYYYDNDRLVRVTDVLGNDWLYTYNDDGLMVSKTDPEGYSLFIGYNSMNYVKSVVDDNGIGTFFEYKYLEADHLFYSRVESSGGAVTETWFNDENMDVVKIVKNGLVVLQVIDDYKAKKFVDANGNITIKRFNDVGNIVEIIYPDNSRKQYIYDASGTRLIEEINEIGAVTRYSYDARGLIVAMISGYGTDEAFTIEMTYDESGNVLTRTKVWLDENQVEQRRTTSFEYDDFGNMITRTDPDNKITGYTYDIRGQVVTMTDPAGHVWENTFNAAGQRLAEKNPLNEIIRYEFDKVGNLIARIYPDSTDPAGKRFSYGWDGHKNLVEEVNPRGDTTRYEYNSDFRRTKIIDGEGRETRFVYDSLGRLLKEIDGNNNEIAYSYGKDPAGGCSSCSLHENRGLVTAIDYPTYRLEM
jgi:YD repeat-containing protein